VAIHTACVDEDATKLAAVTNKGTLYTFSLVGGQQAQAEPQPTASANSTAQQQFAQQSPVSVTLT